jgi:hypothetical protein
MVPTQIFKSISSIKLVAQEFGVHDLFRSSC